METIWVLIIIVSGHSTAGPDSMPGLISGDAYSRATFYFETAESCNAAREATIASKDRLTMQFDEATYDIKECTTLVVENKVR